jgi:formamidopyrimidine-DNA glycosylase
MPELPEVETTRRGIGAHAIGRRVASVIVRERRLRYPVPRALQNELAGHAIDAIERRGKYLLLVSKAGTVIVHLGMSGSLRVVPASTPPTAHDHLDIVFTDGRCLRLRDPRRFGCVLWTRGDPRHHRLLRDLGPEPLSDEFSGDVLYRVSRSRRCAVKSLLMDSHIVVGVGNIYANEALFRAGIRPDRAADRIGLERYRKLTAAVKRTLEEAIRAGGTTLRDFQDSDGRPGYFSQALQVYGRAGEPCRRCGAPLRQRVIGQRATYYCAACQH